MCEKTITMAAEDCIACGISFEMPLNLQNRLKQSGATFYCPNGHSQSYIVKPAIKQEVVDGLKKQLDEAQERNVKWREAYDEIEGHRRKSLKYMQQLRRFINLLLGGQCPYCSKKFSNTLLHIEIKHKERIKNLKA